MAKKIANLKPPTFIGREDPLVLENWLRDIEKIFTSNGTPDNQKVDHATFYLREDADLWWETQGPTIRMQPNFDWSTFKTAMRARFFPEHIRRQKCSEFTRFNQGSTMSVEEYAQKFHEYARFCPNMVPDEAAKAQKFEDGLSFRIQKRLGGSTSHTFMEAYGKACNMERILKREEEVLGRIKRKDQSGNSQTQGYEKKARYGGNNSGGNHQGGRYTNNNSSHNNNQGQRRPGDNNKKVFVCKKCNKSHPGFTCQGERIKCFQSANLDTRPTSVQIGKLTKMGKIGETQ
ncbi:uncharacterized protein LOC130590490 [Beta vulgaris subsp. vulgaris]|uniref:uncharacterized protein LOC130590490 n=1 Tax=Beta vulgaris subsp. vulgaris TaxID=3555 RepID=UPI002549C016|nr:uncharacterized protein LOC130590490 [Beta vulgaris subsp. vulgaris]